MFDWYKEEVVPGWDDYCEPKCCTWELVRQHRLQTECVKKLELIITGDLGGTDFDQMNIKWEHRTRFKYV